MVGPVTSSFPSSVPSQAGSSEALDLLETGNMVGWRWQRHGWHPRIHCSCVSVQCTHVPCEVCSVHTGPAAHTPLRAATAAISSISKWQVVGPAQVVGNTWLQPQLTCGSVVLWGRWTECSVSRKAVSCCKDHQHDHVVLEAPCCVVLTRRFGANVVVLWTCSAALKHGTGSRHAQHALHMSINSLQCSWW
jgi:hypothetical protein